MLGSIRASRLSFAQATRSARANALNTASIVVMARAPVEHLDVDVRARADARNPSKKSWTSSVWQVADARDARLQIDDRVRPPAEIDRGNRQRFVHRHHEVAGAVDAAPVAERLRHAPRRARCRDPRPCDADRRRDRPWRRSLRSNAPCRANSSSMWSRKRMPVSHLIRALCRRARSTARSGFRSSADRLPRGA